MTLVSSLRKNMFAAGEEVQQLSRDCALIVQEEITNPVSHCPVSSNLDWQGFKGRDCCRSTETQCGQWRTSDGVFHRKLMTPRCGWSKTGKIGPGSRQTSGDGKEGCLLRGEADTVLRVLARQVETGRARAWEVWRWVSRDLTRRRRGLDSIVGV